jgi:sulfur-carrier protein
MTTISLHYWAGARAAAGTELESFSAETIAQALDAARRDRDARFAQVLDVCSVLVDGVVLRGRDLDRPLEGPVVVELLPPFAGG